VNKFNFNKFSSLSIIQAALLGIIYYLYCGEASFTNIVVVLFVTEVLVVLKHSNQYLLFFIHFCCISILLSFIYIIFITPCNSTYLAEIALLIFMVMYFIRVKGNE